ncbi:GWxTD domain-containing protein [Acidicapsa ligni]|uniref:GWxTD domain-containing protein n=1 Tax=Acidicapsa ligni TaxID=542300 RepID=UPI0021DFA968|nr:GWxTD domain-containing protein [Acidicapsa ligni]
MNIAFEVLGWTLIHSLWQVTAIALLYGFLNLFIARTHSGARYGLALIALLSILAVAMGTLWYEYARYSREHLFPGVAAMGNTLPFSVAGGNLLHVNAGPGYFNLAAWLPWLDGVWVAGVLCLSLRTAGGWWWLERMRRNARLEVPSGLRVAFDDMRRRMGITRVVDLRISVQVAGTLTLGIVRSVVVVPASALLSMSEEQMEAVLAHELAHIRRADYLWNLIQTMIETLFFFHPAVRWIGGRMRQERELCCDDIAVAYCGNATVYAQALLRLEEQRSHVSALAMGVNGNQSRPALLHRIARVLGEPIAAERGQGARLIGAAAVCVCVVLFLLPMSRRLGDVAAPAVHAAALSMELPQAKQSTDAPLVTQSTNSLMGRAYRQWVEEDVRWIITPEEKKSFDSLGSDAERDKFIERFWQQRNPTGDATKNAYREEHYRRIAYANMHFRFADEAGWRSDRGRIYIVYGRPHSVDSHPSGGVFVDGVKSKNPFEVWNYSHIDGMGEDVPFLFVDDCDCGRYGLVRR